MAQHTDVEFTQVTYTRTDFTALRAWLQKVPLERISELFYSEDSPQLTSGLERFMCDMRDRLIDRAVVANPQLASGLAHARKSGRISPGVLDVLVKAADLKPTPPNAYDPLGQHFRPKTCAALKTQQVARLGELTELILVRGPGWWRPIPRLGQGRAISIESFLVRHQLLDNLSELRAPQTHLVELKSNPLPIDRIARLPSSLDGSNGVNRSLAFSYISAQNDLEALQAYLMRFRTQPHTLRAYTKEMERFLLWCILIRKTALSNVLADDCEAYKDALNAPPASLTGPRAGRQTGRWRPFSGPLSTNSQRMAINIIKSAFEWLAAVRYLAGNPWATVNSPRPDQELHALQIHKSMSGDLFERLVACLQEHSEGPLGQQYRVTLAAVLLMGESGLRRSEAASATRGALQDASESTVQLLRVLGKRSKWRLVPVSPRSQLALDAHWKDRPTATNDSALLGPISIPKTNAAIAKHALLAGGYSDGALANVVLTNIKRLSSDSRFTVPDMIKLRTMSAHGFRHTFGSMAVAKDLPLDVTQKIMGHASLGTTSIYVQTETTRMVEEASKFFDSH